MSAVRACVSISVLAVSIAVVSAAGHPAARVPQASPVVYRVTFPAAEHHWMQVQMTLTGLGTMPLRLRMSRSSPGRYAIHEFSKNIFSLEASDASGRALSTTHPDVDEWVVATHDDSATITYKIFGDRADGTYLGVDTTHAHMNMPAAFPWVEGFDDRPIRVTFVPPAGSGWKVGTQLYPTEDPFTFTAPNLQYFMDSPTEVSNFVLSTFTAPNTNGSTAQFRLVVHADASQSDADALARLVQRLVREEMAVYGEFPNFEPGTYTFLLDYSPWGEGDGMEHRNSTLITEPGLSLRDPAMRVAALDTIAHEFFHTWNVERIRPAGLEPFDLTRENITCCLWLAEGFTQYYGELLQVRAGATQDPPLAYAARLIASPARAVRSAVEMSEHAPFADAATSIDRNDDSRTFMSYYEVGAAIALAMDLSIRERTSGKSSLDDFMRLLWQRFGKTAEARPGYVGRPYTLQDLRSTLGEVLSDRAAADQFFDRYVQGHDVADYQTLLAPAGYAIKPRSPGESSAGEFSVQDTAAGLLVAALVPFGSPAYDAGIDLGDVITTIDGQRASSSVWAALKRRAPQSSVPITIRRRDGRTAQATITLRPDPAVVIEDQAPSLTSAQTAFRQAWLGSRVK